MAGVTLKGVQKRFDKTVVIKDLDLDIKEHEFMVLVGPSGCGKSTALRMIAGLEEISEGTITIGDRVVNDLPPKDRDIAMVFQSYALYPHMTVRQNLEFGLKIRKMPQAEIEKLVNNAAQMLGIDHLLERKPRELSGGQRQRVAIARAIAGEPPIVLADEPTAALDAENGRLVTELLRDLSRERGHTVVVVTHDNRIFHLADRIVHIEDGLIHS